MRQMRLEDLASYLNQMEGITNGQNIILCIFMYILSSNQSYDFML